MAETLSLRIGTDIDDVLIDTAGAVTGIYNHQYSTALTARNWFNFDPIDPWAHSDLSVLVKRVITIMGSDEFVSTAEPIKGAYDILAARRDAGDYLLAITGRPASILGATVALLDRLYPGMFSDPVMTDYFGHDGQRGTKQIIAREQKLTHYVDDQPDHAASVKKVVPNTYLFGDYPWNQVPVEPPAERVFNWQDLDDKFRER